MKEVYLPNIQLGSQIIVFDQQTRTGELSITNRHNNLGVVFKIKATKLNIIEVKPAKGFIKPMGKIVISFKLSDNLSQQQIQSIQKNDKFLLQFLNIDNQQSTREQVQKVWKAYKNSTANLEHGYGCYRVFMNLTGRKISISNMKNDTINSKMYQTAVRTNNIENDFDYKSGMKSSGFKTERNEQSDEELSRKYEQLKEKEQQLHQKREKVFLQSSRKPTSSGKSSSKNKIILIFLFLFAVLFGNFVRSNLVKVKGIEKIKESKTSFFGII